ncbi:YTH domain-containing protein 1-like isoform X2 [Maniola jurtina]|uniref:YTH domain-containing protein 1-like isoform X2 n=1 Tax=Maniola jurtina TaxID=191418 RepID=UPI001E689A39|nr:YTH domain-containing protein 1-like isoform X2 [Maniola jurtina]
MLFTSELVLFVIFLLSAFASLDPPMQPLIDGSKFVNTIKIQKDLALENDISSRWPSGIVRYYVDKRSYDVIFETLMRSPIHIVQSSSCIEFMSMKEKPSDNTTWLHITNPKKVRECNHEPRFKDTGEIELVFGYDCLKTKEMLHTLLHGIGIKDEVTHPHRDKYIRVLWDNIHPAHQHLYRKQTEKSSKTLVEYDPLSVMHFHDRAFSRNGRATIAPLEPGILISPSDTLSQLDKMRLQIYFGHECNKRKVSNLLKTCKNSLGAKRGEQAGDNGRQNADSDDVDDDYDAENNTAATDNDKNKSTQKQMTDVEDEEEIDLKEEVKNQEEQDVSEIEGQVVEDEDVDDPDVEEEETQATDRQRAEKQDAGEQNAEWQTAEGQSAEQQNEEEPTINGQNSGIENEGNEDGESTNNKNIVVDEDNEKSTKSTNENSDEMKSVKKQLTESAYESDITERTSSEKDLQFENKQDADSDANNVLQKNEIRKQNK